MTTINAKVDSFSKTRKADETIRVTFKDTYAIAKSSGSKEKYIVTRNSCTCKDFFFRKHECRHMKAVNESVTKIKYW